jgi:hypothetical protein
VVGKLSREHNAIVKKAKTTVKPLKVSKIELLICDGFFYLAEFCIWHWDHIIRTLLNPMNQDVGQTMYY